MGRRSEFVVSVCSLNFAPAATASPQDPPGCISKSIAGVGDCLGRVGGCLHMALCCAKTPPPDPETRLLTAALQLKGLTRAVVNDDGSTGVADPDAHVSIAFVTFHSIPLRDYFLMRYNRFTTHFLPGARGRRAFPPSAPRSQRKRLTFEEAPEPGSNILLQNIHIPGWKRNVYRMISFLAATLLARAQAPLPPRRARLRMASL